jgi:serine/threonine-protein kinase
VLVKLPRYLTVFRRSLLDRAESICDNYVASGSAPDRRFDHTMNVIPSKLGRYHVLEEVGRGAMGVVYKAYDPVIEREVAIKAIELSFRTNNEETQLYLKRFYREAKAAGKLNHPNIVTIYDVDEDKETGTPYIVMEFLEGSSLQETTSSGIRLDLEDTKKIIMQVADALDYAHRNGIVHRDIKSANILILDGLKVKIADFGIARMPSSDLTQEGQFVGTPNYMSPEQIQGKSIDGRSDLFSLGVIFYMLLTGERPFSGDSITAISYKIIHSDPIPARTLNPSVPDDWNRVLFHLLSKDPSLRYQTGAELMEDLRLLGSLSPIGEVTNSVQDPTQAYEPNSVPVPKHSRTGPTGSFHAPPIGQPGAVALKAPPRIPPLYLMTGIAIAVLSAGFGLFWWQNKEHVDTSTHPIAMPVSKPATDRSNDAPPPPAASAADEARLSLINTKWNLAMNYYQNGFYEKCIDELNGVLELDPNHAEAKKYLQMAEEKKALKPKSKKKRKP